MIDVSSIPPEVQSTAEFRFHYLKMMARLKDPTFVKALFAHEAAHVIYYERAGTFKYGLLKPQLRYDPVAKKFIGHFAAVDVKEFPAFYGPDSRELLIYFTKMAHGHVAGGVVGRKFFPGDDGGDQVDKIEFFKFCADLHAHYPQLRINAEDWWQRAQVAVEGEIEKDPHVLDIILKKSVEIRTALGF